MKLFVFLTAFFATFSFAVAADGSLKEKAKELSKAYKDSVLFITAVVEIEMTAGENAPKKEERKVETLGTVIRKDGLIVTSLSTLDVASSIDGRMINTQQGPMKLSAKGTTKEVKILMPDGSEVAAKVSFKDTDLDLAFIQPEKDSKASFTAIDTANRAPMEMLDDVIIMGRLSKDLNREPVTMTQEIISVVSKPRVFGKLSTQSVGMPIFNKDGKFLGIGINRFSPKSDSESSPVPQNVVLSADDLMESAGQVK